MNIPNPYSFPDQDWYTHNNFTYVCDMVIEEADFPVEPLDEQYALLLAAPNTEERLVILDSLLLYLGVAEPESFNSPVNVNADIIQNSKIEDLPKILFLLDNPDVKSLPVSFNALTHPEYFKYLGTQEEDYQSRDVYNDVLKRSLDVRNNRLDARKFNTGMTSDQIVALASNKLDLTVPAPEVLEIEEDTKRNIFFSPNSMVNSQNTSVSSSVQRLQDMVHATPMKSKAKEQQFSLESLLKKDEE
jgi:hypothetical protein